jgi:hypothetical protein
MNFGFWILDWEEVLCGASWAVHSESKIRNSKFHRAAAVSHGAPGGHALP